MKKWSTFINQPYPFIDSIGKKIFIIFGVGIFVALFLIIFQPFGLDYYKHPNKIYVLLGYGVVTIAILSVIDFILPLLFRTYFSEKNWTLKKELIAILWIIPTLGLGGQFYCYMIGLSPLNIHIIIKFQLHTFLIGIFPIVFLKILAYNHLIKQNLKRASELNNNLKSIQNLHHQIPLEEQEIKLIAENQKSTFNVKTSDLLFMTSLDNYIEIHWKQQNKIRKTLFRSTLKRVEQTFADYPSICRCHRTYIVNIFNIKNINGNAQGYKLEMKYVNYEIPVSRNNWKKIKEHFIKNKGFHSS